MGFSVDQIESLLSGYERDYTDYEGWNYWFEENFGSTILALDLDAEVIAKGGPTGYDYEVWFVVKVTSLDEAPRFFKKNGYYNSYEGHDWDGSFDEVFPETRTVTVYEKV